MDGQTLIPGSYFMQPTLTELIKIVALTGMPLNWQEYFQKLLTEGEDGAVVVLESACPKLAPSLSFPEKLPIQNATISRVKLMVQMQRCLVRQIYMTPSTMILK